MESTTTMLAPPPGIWSLIDDECLDKFNFGHQNGSRSSSSASNSTTTKSPLFDHPIEDLIGDLINFEESQTSYSSAFALGLDWNNPCKWGPIGSNTQRALCSPNQGAAQDRPAFNQLQCERPVCNRLHVSNIPFRYRREHLANMFSMFGPVLDSEIIFNERGSKGFGFVSFAQPEDAERAKRSVDGLIIDGRKIEVNYATPRPKKWAQAKCKTSSQATLSSNASLSPSSATDIKFIWPSRY